MEPEESGRRKEYSLERSRGQGWPLRPSSPRRDACVSKASAVAWMRQKGSRHRANCGTGTSWKKCRYRRPETMARLLNRTFSSRTPPTQRTEALALVFKDEHARAMEGMAGTRTGQSCPCLFLIFRSGRGRSTPRLMSYRIQVFGVSRCCKWIRHNMVTNPFCSMKRLELLSAQLGEVVLDCTTGRGGHALALAGKIGAKGTLLCLDVDPVNLAFAKQRSITSAQRAAFFRPILRSCQMFWMPLKFPRST